RAPLPAGTRELRRAQQAGDMVGAEWRSQLVALPGRAALETGQLLELPAHQHSRLVGRNADFLHTLRSQRLHLRDLLQRERVLLERLDLRLDHELAHLRVARREVPRLRGPVVGRDQALRRHELRDPNHRLRRLGFLRQIEVAEDPGVDVQTWRDVAGARTAQRACAGPAEGPRVDGGQLASDVAPDLELAVLAVDLDGGARVLGRTE